MGSACTCKHHAQATSPSPSVHSQSLEQPPLLLCPWGALLGLSWKQAPCARPEPTGFLCCACLCAVLTAVWVLIDAGLDAYAGAKKPPTPTFNPHYLAIAFFTMLLWSHARLRSEFIFQKLDWVKMKAQCQGGNGVLEYMYSPGCSAITQFLPWITGCGDVYLQMRPPSMHVFLHHKITGRYTCRESRSAAAAGALNSCPAVKAG